MDKSIKYIIITALVMAVCFAGCAESNKRKPDKIVKNSRQLAKIYGDSLGYIKANLITTVVITDSANNPLKVDITRDIMNNLHKLLGLLIDFNFTDRMDEILKMKDKETAERELLKEMDRMAKECGFENISFADKLIDKLKDYPEISALLNKLAEIGKTKYM